MRTPALTFEATTLPALARAQYEHIVTGPPIDETKIWIAVGIMLLGAILFVAAMLGKGPAVRRRTTHD